MLEEYDRIYSREPVASTHEGFGGFDSWEAFDKANHEWQDELAAARTSLEDYFRTLQREIEALREWKTSVLNALESKPDFQAAEWAGDKRGWGFVFEYINWLHRDRAALLSDNERLLHMIELRDKAIDSLRSTTLTQYEAETVLMLLEKKPFKGPEIDDRYDAEKLAIAKLREIAQSRIGT